MVYETTLQLEKEAEDKRIWLEFEAVYQNAFVYVNNAFAGKCAYGYSNFYLDITDFVKIGQANVIKVIVKMACQADAGIRVAVSTGMFI